MNLFHPPKNNLPCCGFFALLFGIFLQGCTINYVIADSNQISADQADFEQINTQRRAIEQRPLPDELGSRLREFSKRIKLYQRLQREVSRYENNRPRRVAMSIWTYASAVRIAESMTDLAQIAKKIAIQFHRRRNRRALTYIVMAKGLQQSSYKYYQMIFFLRYLSQQRVGDDPTHQFRSNRWLRRALRNKNAIVQDLRLTRARKLRLFEKIENTFEKAGHTGLSDQFRAYQASGAWRRTL